jgi:hypothetical protein
MAQNRDFFVDAGTKRAAQLEAERAACQADLQAFRAQGDYEGASEAVQRLANIDAESRNLHNLYERYVASQTPRQPLPENDAEKRAKSWDRMTWADVVDMTRTSKYASQIDGNDPNMIAGYQEAMRRRQRGE